jgi:hypothetical protein
MRGETAAAENLQKEKCCSTADERTTVALCLCIVWAIDELGFLLIFVFLLLHCWTFIFIPLVYSLKPRLSDAFPIYQYNLTSKPTPIPILQTKH